MREKEGDGRERKKREGRAVHEKRKVRERNNKMKVKKTMVEEDNKMRTK